MKIAITGTEPHQINTSTMEKISFIVDYWNITYLIVFGNLPDHELTGQFKWRKKTLDLQEVTEHLRETYTNLKQLR